MPKITFEMKREIVAYLLQYSKGLIEDDQECPSIAKALDAGEITPGDVEDAVDEIQGEVLATLK